jgi:hypothetical protein
MGSLLPSNAIPLTQIIIQAASIGAAYTLIGTFTSPIELLTIVSTLDQPVQLSYGGVNDHQVVPIGNTTPSIIPLNFKDNLMTMPPVSVYAKRIGTPTTGSLSVSAFTAQTP